MRPLLINNIVINISSKQELKSTEIKIVNPLIIKAVQMYPKGTKFKSTDPKSKRIFISTGDFYIYFGSVVAFSHLSWSAPVYCAFDNKWAKKITEDDIYLSNLLDKMNLEESEKKRNRPLFKRLFSFLYAVNETKI